MGEATVPIEASFLPELPEEGGRPKLIGSPVLIDSKIFEGCIGGAFLGTHTGLDLPVLVRVLRPELRAQLKDFERYISETRRLARVRHPNVAAILDIGQANGHDYVVFEYVCGVPLMERIKTRALTPPQALDILLPVAEGLAEMWRLETVHRAVGPHTILLQCDGPAKLDLTILRRDYTDPLLVQFLRKTQLPYWSPEELRGEPAGPAADMWSFGATLQHALTGQPPFAGKTCEELQAAILNGTPADPRALVPDLPAPLVELLSRLLARDPENRFISGEAFLAALRAVREQLGRPQNVHSTVYVAPPTPGTFGPAGTAVPPVSPASASPASPAAPATPMAVRDPRVGDTIGQCVLTARAGAGAFGVVYRARHTVLDIDVAVKIVPPEVALREPGYVQLFLREARTAARIRHPNVIGIFAAGEQDGHHYIVMEFAPGGTVWDRMQLFGGKLPVEEGIAVLRDTARGLLAAERLGIVHRDIKPDNLMYGADGEVKIADLGLAKRTLASSFMRRGAVPGAVRESVLADQLTQRTDPNMMAGTPAYMAPEMALDPQNIDSRADLYSLGVTAYHFFTGTLPFEGANTLETIMKHVSDRPEPPKQREPELPEEINRIVLRLLEKTPGARYGSAAELLKALGETETALLALA